MNAAITVRGPADGVHVCLLHSLGLDAHMFDALMDALPDVRFIVYDQRGHGAAMNSPDSTTLDFMASDVLEVMDRLEVPDAHLVGHSMGGLVAGIAASRMPRRFRSMAIVAAPFVGVPAFEERANQVLPGGLSGVIGETLERWFTPDSLASGASYVAYARRTLAAMSVAHWRAAWRTMHGFTGFDHLARPLPLSLCVSGKLDRSAPPQVVAQIRASLGAGAKHISLEDAAHMVAIEQPGKLAAVLQRFWRLAEEPHLTEKDDDRHG